MHKQHAKGLRLRGDVYYAHTRVDGIPIEQRIGKVSESQAKIILSKLIAETYENKFIDKKQENFIKINELLIEYSTKKLKFVKSSQTRLHLLKPLIRLLGESVVKNLRISGVEQYRRTRLSEPKTSNGRILKQTVSISTVNHEVKELLIALQWAVRERIIEFNPIAGIEHLREPEPEKVMLDKGSENGNDWLRLYNAIGEKHRQSGKLTVRGMKNRLKFYIQYHTGMRIGEVNKIEYAWIDQINMRLNLPADKTKAQKGRSIPISIDIVQQISEYVDATKNTPYYSPIFIFYNPKTGSHEKSSYKAFSNAAERAGLAGITSHALRRTRGTIWDGIDERASMEALGHADYKVHRKHYTKVTADRLSALIKSADNERTSTNTAS